MAGGLVLCPVCAYDADCADCWICDMSSVQFLWQFVPGGYGMTHSVWAWLVCLCFTYYVFHVSPWRDLQEHPCQHRCENEFKCKRIECTNSSRKCWSVLGQGSPEVCLQGPCWCHAQPYPSHWWAWADSPYQHAWVLELSFLKGHCTQVNIYGAFLSWCFTFSSLLLCACIGNTYGAHVRNMAKSAQGIAHSRA